MTLSLNSVRTKQISLTAFQSTFPAVDDDYFGKGESRKKETEPAQANWAVYRGSDE